MRFIAPVLPSGHPSPTLRSRRRASFAAALLATLAVAFASAESSVGSLPPVEPVAGATSASVPAASGSGDVRRDPLGVKGVSPFREALARADGLYLARDFDGALREYRAAVALEPKNPLGHLRLAELELRREQYPSALEALSAAERFAGDDAEARARVAYLRATTLERQRNFDVAVEAYESYGKLAVTAPPTSAAPVPAATPAASPAPIIYAGAAEERRRMIAARKKLEADYAAVKVRVDAEAERAKTPTN